MDSEGPPNDAILFRPRKKRKTYKQRAGDDDEDTGATEAASPPVQSLDELISQASHEAEENVSMAEILRLRKQRKPRAGVEFKASGNLLRDEEGELVVQQEAGAQPKEVGIVNRFTTQTGTVGDVNKHMMAYIDSEIEKRRTDGPPKVPTKTAAPAAPNASWQPKKDIDVRTNLQQQGKLLEVDLGEEARLKNIELTDLARRRLAGEEIKVEEPPKKIRLGPDGKPWRSKKKGKTEEEIKREKMVEDVLRETRLEIYEETPEPQAMNDDQAADDRIADAFKKEFMNAISDRNRSGRKPNVQPTIIRSANGKVEEELKGPKLGGSRAARASMREAILKEKEKGKKK